MQGLHDGNFSTADKLKLPRLQHVDLLPRPLRMVLENKGNLDCGNYRLHITTHQLQCNILISLSLQTGAEAVQSQNKKESLRVHTKVTPRI